MRVNFFGPDPAYHEARQRFVFKGKPPLTDSRTPIQATAEGVQAVLSQGAAQLTSQDADRSAPSRSIAGVGSFR